MSISYDAYLAYGVKIPVGVYDYDENGDSPGNQLSKALNVPTVQTACPNVGYVTAGHYDRHMFFLVTECKDAELGEYTRVGFDENGRSLGEKEVDWDRQLRHAIEIMGWTRFDLEDFGWFVVASES